MSDPAQLLEQEWQFDTPLLQPVVDWLEGWTSPDLVVRDGGTVVQTDTYLDTPDRRFYQARVALRARFKPGKGWELTLKTFGETKGGRRLRMEINEPIATDLGPEADVVGLLALAQGPVWQRGKAVVGRERLGPLFVIENARTTYFLQEQDTMLAEVALDDVTVRGETRIRLLRIEIEMGQGLSVEQQERVEQFVEAMCEACSLTEARQSKFALGVQSAKIELPAPDVGLPAHVKDVGDDPGLGALAWAMFRQHWTAFRENEFAMRFGEDEVALHRARVALRRLRSALRFFGKHLPEDDRTYVASELRWITRATSAVRDLDVQQERFAQWRSDRDEAERFSFMEALQEGYRARHREARTSMVHTLNSSRYDRFVKRFEALLREGPPSEGESARRLLPAQVLKAYADLRLKGDSLTPESPAEQFHELRLLAKRLRYLLEAIAPLYGKKVVQFTEVVTEVQKLLGDHQDACVALDLLDALFLNREVSEDEFAFVQTLRESNEEHARALREDFPDTYKAVCGKAWSKAWKALED